ncbi:MAG TPA: hypothetical protein VLA51_06600 [Paracoccaceae bacterium]|nr:hypothetical protein [Paracoccaceae bacterium]
MRRMITTDHMTPNDATAKGSRILPADSGISCFLGHLHPRVFSHLGIRVFGYLGIWVLGYFGIWVLASLGLSASATPLDDQITAFKAAPTQTEAAVSQILQSGLKEYRSAVTFATVKP